MNHKERTVNTWKQKYQIAFKSVVDKPMAKTKNGMTHKIDEKRIPNVNKMPNAVAQDINGRIQAAAANKI